MSVAHDEHAGPWTLADVLALPEDARHRVELVGGALVMSPAPGLPHQWASRRLAGLLDEAAAAAHAPVEIFEAVNVVVPDGLLIPDIVVVDATADLTGTTVSAHDVLAVVEIASPSTRITDRKLKPGLYAAAGVAHFWRLDLEPVPRLVVAELVNGAYVEQLPVPAGAEADIRRPFPLRLDPGVLRRR